MKSIATACLAVLAASASAWDDTGHMTVAQIAHDHLLPGVAKQMDALLASNPGPDFTDFVRSATFPDQLKRFGIKTYNDWHSIPTPWEKDGIKATPVPKQNAVWAIGQCMKTLQNPKAPELERARMLRFLIHIVGDLHQPLHAITLWDSAHKEGDDIAHNYLIDIPGEKPQLHAAWDTAFGIFHDLDDSRVADLAPIRSLADQLEKSFPEKNDAKDLNVKHWAQESYELAKGFAYTTPEHQQPSAEYIRQAQRIATGRIALAGYRLASLLNAAFGAGSKK